MSVSMLNIEPKEDELSGQNPAVQDFQVEHGSDRTMACKICQAWDAVVCR